MEFRVLGPLDVLDGGRPVHVGGAKPRALLGTLLLQAATQKDYPMLEAGILTIGVVYMVATLVADLLYSYLNPRIRYAGLE